MPRANRILLFLACLSLAGASFVPASRAADQLEMGRDHMRQFQEGHLDALWKSMTAEMHEALGSTQALKDLRAALQGRFGAEEEVLSEDVGEEAGYRVYARTARHERNTRPLSTRFIYDAEGRIAGFFTQPAEEAAQSRFLDYQTQASLRLPFDGTWRVYWGGRTINENYHAVDRAQRFALDLVAVEDGATHRGEGRALEDYHCWDRPILAPAAGTVVAVVRDLPDLPIGEMDPRNPAGNHVVLDFGNDEFGFLAHLRKESVKVEIGDRVGQGEELGRCGNSGNTTEPHLHFHLQTTPTLHEGEGLPAQFVRYGVNGRDVERGEPRRGETVEQR